MENIKKLREYTGLRQTDVAEMLGVSIRPYQRYENCETKDMHCRIASIIKKEIQKKIISKIENADNPLIDEILIYENRVQITINYKYFKLKNISDYVPKFIVQSLPLSSGNWSVRDFATESKIIHQLCDSLNKKLT